MDTYIHSREQVIEFLKKAKTELDEYYGELVSKNFQDDVNLRLVSREANSVFTLSKRLVMGQFKGGESIDSQHEG